MAYASGPELDFHLLCRDLPEGIPAPADPPPDLATTHVYATADGWAAELAVMQLHQRGVWAAKRRRYEDAEAKVRRPYQIWVIESDADRARAILVEFRGKGTALPDAG